MLKKFAKRSLLVFEAFVKWFSFTTQKKIKETKFFGENFFLKNFKKIFSEISKFWLKKFFPTTFFTDFHGTSQVK